MAVSFRAFLVVVLVLLVIGTALPGAQARSRRRGASRAPRRRNCESAEDCRDGECCPERLGRCRRLNTRGRYCRLADQSASRFRCPCEAGFHCRPFEYVRYLPVHRQSGTCAEGEPGEFEYKQLPRPAPRPKQRRRKGGRRSKGGRRRNRGGRGRRRG
ncbi:uncharacterized protein LOC144914747 [Branchiostoma floridae x Branchiostoma belcheri]